MKYRRLSKEELFELENEFIRFLSSQAISSDEWKEIKENKPEVANDLIDIFSDMVFEGIIERVEYLELKTAKDYKTIFCETDKMTMLGLLIEGDSELDFTSNQSPASMMEQLQKSGAKLKMYQGQKAYSKTRNQELFEWMEKGALISKDGQMYKLLEGLIDN